MKRILVVEDDLALSAGLCFELDAAGYTAIPAYNCVKARHLFQQEQQLALALLDVNLPDGSGFALCRELKEERPELPVIFLTANDLEQDVLTGFDMGAEDYVTKPFNMQILLKRLEVALRRVGQQPAPAAPKEYAPAPEGSMEEKIEKFLTGLLTHMNSTAVPHAYRTEEGSYRAELVGGDGAGQASNRAEPQRVVAADDKRELSVVPPAVNAVGQLAAGVGDLAEVFHGRFRVLVGRILRGRNNREAVQLVAALFDQRGNLIFGKGHGGQVGAGIVASVVQRYVDQFDVHQKKPSFLNDSLISSPKTASILAHFCKKEKGKAENEPLFFCKNSCLPADG